MPAGAPKGADAALLTHVAEHKTTGAATMAADASLVARLVQESVEFASIKAVADQMVVNAAQRLMMQP